MRKEADFKYRDRFIQIGLMIGFFRRMRGMSQEQLAEKANISRTYLSVIEAPNMARAISLEVLFDIADALEVEPSDLLSAKFPK